MAAQRFRIGFKFWLNIENPQEEEVAGQIEDLKKSRSFARTVRDGIRLMYDLRRGKTEVLRELFPWVLEQNITASEQHDEAPSTTTEKRLNAHIDRLEALLLQQGAMPIVGGKPSESPIPSARKAQTALDDVEITVTKARDSAENRSDWNFAIASAAVVCGNYDALPPHIVEYGVRTGRIVPDALKKRPPRPKHMTSKTAESVPGGPKRMDVPQLEPPNFDDMTDLFG